MNGITLAILIIMGIILLIILWKLLKPYFIKYDSTLCFVGGLGSGKSISSVKQAIICIRKQRIKYYYIANFKRAIANRVRKIINYFHKKYNLKHAKDKNFKKFKKIYEIKKYNRKPLVYCNIPMHYKKHLFGHDREWSVTLKASHILCLEEIIEYSVVVIDELPQFINQFNWNQELIQKNVNEFITYFRHYIGGYLIVNAQSIDDVVVQIRRKLNQATWCFDFHKWAWPIPLFYTIRMCDMILSDQVQTMSTTYIEDNTRLHFGLFPARKTYDTRCYSERYKNIYKEYKEEPRYEKLKINKVLRLVKYISPLDDKTTETQKKEQWTKGEEIWKN